ncbi:uncharacterized protein PHACADRAFT_200704 [Phanerochaete carnosa HHB-10118-sp]|uniref:Uncharacterized protein n=1 Tax=Phanerochaete carnosa (strain HHB-10118-sp) TaxID=650164 RepID=K5VW11_PHACS|nr:uncharacterized protein PHACADRAFT_200704 [Phanerochaete carnosa HHB-10118-sp]EKM50769.1 hypothetical protein PHACADRAFT_200704 [Phanerochaete carnosa HHB-10118-sp]
MGDTINSTTLPDVASEALRDCVPIEFSADSLVAHADFITDSVTSTTIIGGLYTELVTFAEQASASLHEVVLAAIRILHLRYSAPVLSATNNPTGLSYDNAEETDERSVITTGVKNFFDFPFFLAIYKVRDYRFTSL